MRDEVVRLPMIGQILRRTRWLLAAFAVFGAGLGAVAWVLVPTSFTSTSTVLLEGERSDQQVLTEAQVAASRVVVGRAVDELGWDPPKNAVSSEVGDGNVIKITAVADTAAHARALARQVTKQYKAFSARSATRAANATLAALSDRRKTLKKRLHDLDRAIGQLTSQAADETHMDALRNRRTSLLNQLDNIEDLIAKAKAEAAVGGATIGVIEHPKAPTSPTTPGLLELVAAGVVVVPLLALLALVGFRLTDKRLRRASDIASALGAPVLGTVRVPNDTSAGPRSGGRRALSRWFLEAGSARAAPVDDEMENLRCGRVLDRLRDGPGDRLELLVVSADDDHRAVDGVARLATAAADASPPVSVVADDRRLAPAVDAQASTRLPPSPAEAGPDAPPAGGASGVVRVRTVTATRPTIPNVSPVSGALVTLTSGTRSAWELVAMAEACHDAGLPVRGALVVVPAGAEEELGEDSPASEPNGPAPRPGQRSGHAFAGSQRLNGHARGVVGP